MAPPKKRRLVMRYRIRRIILVLFVLAAVGIAIWRLLPGLQDKSTQVEGKEEPSSASPETSLSQSESESQLESQSESELESSSEQETAPAMIQGDWRILLVNQDHAIPEGYENNLELATMADGFQVDKRIVESAIQMYTQAKADGITLVTCSAYRSVEKQTTNFNAKVQELLLQGYSEGTAEQETATIIAPPKYSEHHTGLALDIVTPENQNLDESFANTPAYQWLSENAFRYGFILRYPKDKKDITGIIFEPWHYRYVGVENATAIHESGYCLEEWLFAERAISVDEPVQSDSNETEETLASVQG